MFTENPGVRSRSWPDGTVAGRYRFRHALGQAVVYARLTAPRAMRLHWQIGARLEAAYGPQAQAYATALADHFVRGRDDQRAAVYLRQAGENALRRWAYTEAFAQLTRGLDVLQRWPESTARVEHELDIQLLLGPPCWPPVASPPRRPVGRICARGSCANSLGRRRSALRCCGALDGQVEAGLEVLAAALDLVHTRGLRVCEAEVYRLRGTLLLAQHSPGQTPTATRVEEAVACFEQALALARQRQAGAWELRAATSLARLWQQQGRGGDARALLAPVYGRLPRALTRPTSGRQRRCSTSSVRSRLHF